MIKSWADFFEARGYLCNLAELVENRGLELRFDLHWSLRSNGCVDKQSNKRTQRQLVPSGNKSAHALPS